MAQQTLRGTNKKAIRKSGFRSRMKIKSGKKIINKRRMKHREKLSLK
jgi:large subunit ribosomal protein L34